jgi:hypothetical protein
MTDPKADCEELMNRVVPFAQQMLTTYGEFFPFGATMRPDREIALAAGNDGVERPPSEDVIRSIKRGYIQGAREGLLVATALIYDIRIQLPSTNEKTDAIAVSLNHRDNYSIIVIFPYKIQNGKLILGHALAQKGEADVFPPQ